MKFCKKGSKIFFLLITAISMALTPAISQTDSVDYLRSSGKIYVVVAVIAAIFIGIVLFLIFLDRRLTKLEDHFKNEQ